MTKRYDEFTMRIGPGGKLERTPLARTAYRSPQAKAAAKKRQRAMAPPLDKEVSDATAGTAGAARANRARARARANWDKMTPAERKALGRRSVELIDPHGRSNPGRGLAAERKEQAKRKAREARYKPSARSKVAPRRKGEK